MSRPPITLPPDIREVVARALEEDVGTGDLTAKLIHQETGARAQVIVRESSTLCGSAWFAEVFRQLEPRIVVRWHHDDGDRLAPETVICELQGPARPLLTGERTALNFLQTLSGTATATREYVDTISGTTTRILDTRKTLPGMRHAQKYAVRCGGGENHRHGLYDGILIKENHIAAAGSIRAAAAAARQQDTAVLVEIEAESLEELRDALAADVDRVLLDNFSLDLLREAVGIRDASDGPRVGLEASGGIELEGIRAVAETGVDFISVGAITKNLRAVDFSMRFL